MQKQKKPAPAKKAQTGKSKHARIRKPLTQEQRDRKNLRERERRAKLREEKLANAGKSCKQVKAVKVVKDNLKSVAKKGCNSCSKKCDDKCKVNKDMTPESVFNGIAKAVQKAKFKQEEPGVIGCEFAIPGGGKAFVHFVDLSEIDPLSRFSPIPSQLRHSLLLARMAREISDIVDRNIGMPG